MRDIRTLFEEKEQKRKKEKEIIDRLIKERIIRDIGALFEGGEEEQKIIINRKE